MKTHEIWFLAISLAATVLVLSFVHTVRGKAVLPDSRVLHPGICLLGADMDAELLGRDFRPRPVTRPQDLWLALEDDGSIHTARSPVYERYSQWRNGHWTIITGHRRGKVECIIVVMRDLP